MFLFEWVILILFHGVKIKVTGNRNFGNLISAHLYPEVRVGGNCENQCGFSPVIFVVWLCCGNVPPFPILMLIRVEA